MFPTVDQHRAWVTQEWLSGRSQKSIAHELGFARSAQVCSAIRNFCIVWGSGDVDGIYGDDRKEIAKSAMKQWLASIAPHVKPEANRRVVTGYPMSEARSHHAFRLRVIDKLKYEDIGKRLGVTRQHAYVFTLSGARREAKKWMQSGWGERASLEIVHRQIARVDSRVG